jgi:hypothetical protein
MNLSKIFSKKEDFDNVPLSIILADEGKGQGKGWKIFLWVLVVLGILRLIVSMK